MSVSWNLAYSFPTPTQQPIFKLAFAPEGDLLACSSHDGLVYIYSTQTTPFKLLTTLHVSHGEDAPILSLAFKPLKASSLFQTTKSQSQQRLLLIAHGFKGVMSHYDLVSGKVVRTHSENGNEIYAVAYRHDGRYFCSAGKDRCVRVYDSRTFELKQVLDSSSMLNTGSSKAHVNRVFAVRFHPTDNNVIISAGWDCNVQIWSLADEGSVRNLHGAYVCGDALDIDKVKGDVIITGSWRPSDQLQMWSYKTGKLIKTVPFEDETKGDGKPKLNVYTTCFNPECDTVACGGSGSKGIKILDRFSGKILGKLDNLNKGLYTAEFSPQDSILACAGGDGVVYVMQKSLRLSRLGSRSDTPEDTQSDVI